MEIEKLKTVTELNVIIISIQFVNNAGIEWNWYRSPMLIISVVNKGI